MIQRRTLFSAFGASALLTALPGSAFALIQEGDGSNPIRLIVPYPPGGPLDVAARVLADAVKDRLGHVIVTNRAGAGGSVGMSYAKRQKPDGRTLVLGAVATQAINPHIYRRIPYDPQKDFKPVTLISHVPNVLVVSSEWAAKKGVTDLKSFVAYAKKHPGQLNYASGGNGSAGHLAAEWMKYSLGLDIVHIPFAGAAAAQLSLLSGQTDLSFDNLANALMQIKTGNILPLAVTTPERSPELPGVPTMKESGIENFDISTWYGLFVPSATDRAIVSELNAIFTEALVSDAVSERLTRLGAKPRPTTPEAFQALIEQDYEKYGYLVKLSEAKVD